MDDLIETVAANSIVEIAKLHKRIAGLEAKLEAAEKLVSFLHGARVLVDAHLSNRSILVSPEVAEAIQSHLKLKAVSDE